MYQHSFKIVARMGDASESCRMRCSYCASNQTYVRWLCIIFKLTRVGKKVVCRTYLTVWTGYRKIGVNYLHANASILAPTQLHVTFKNSFLWNHMEISIAHSLAPLPPKRHSRNTGTTRPAAWGTRATHHEFMICHTNVWALELQIMLLFEKGINMFSGLGVARNIGKTTRSDITRCMRVILLLLCSSCHAF